MPLSRITLLFHALLVLGAALSAAEEGPLPLDGGKLAASGKFVPKEPPAVAGPADAEQLQAEAKALVRKLGEDELEIGEVRLNQRLRRISFQANIAERERPLEYALVHESGKIHEALFSTKAAARDLHVAALLLHAVGQAPAIVVTWPKHGGEAKVPLAELIRMDGGSLSGGWNYNGSQFMQGGFAAQREGSFIALLNDPAALINHPAAGALQRDDVFSARKELLPPAGVTVTIHLTFPPVP